jgi:hypothetical protein
VYKMINIMGNMMGNIMGKVGQKLKIGFGRSTFLPISLLVLGSAAMAQPNEIIDNDTISSGVSSSTKFNFAPCGYKISWINFDSGFRGSGLAIGDLVVAVGTESIICPPPLVDTRDQAVLQLHQRLTQRGLGGISEYLVWREKATKDNTPLTLKVLRRARNGVGTETLEITGRLRAGRSSFDANNRPSFGLDGPTRFINDGFSSAWSSWYEDFTRFASRVLDGGWQNRIDSRRLLTEHLEKAKRVEFLTQRYPGSFAKAVSEDYERVRLSLLGTPYQISDRDLEYRSLGEIRAKQVLEASNKTRTALLQQLSKDTIVAFPTVDPVLSDRSKVVGKIVVLPVISSQDWVAEPTGCSLASGSRENGYYFVACDHPAMRRTFEAFYRYQRSVSPDLKENYAIIGRILPNPRMLIVNGKATVGLTLEPVAVSVEDKVFVDLSQNTNGVSFFAGETALNDSGLKAPSDNATPRQVIETFITALKWGDEKLWTSLFASWSVLRDETGVLFNPSYGLPVSLSEDWIRSRRTILDSVFDVRIAYLGDVEQIMTGTEFKGAPVIEQTYFELDHVGRFDNAYFSFGNINVHRVWRLQRINNGPWRIATIQGI